MGYQRWLSLVGLLGMVMVPQASLGQPVETQAFLSPKPGWSVWWPRERVEEIPIMAGFSNMELGGMLDFQAACAEAMGVPADQVSAQMDSIPYWFRISDAVGQIGTGKVEYGCWVNGTL